MERPPAGEGSLDAAPGAPPVGVRGLESFIEEIRDRRAEEAEKETERCPIDGTVLSLVDLPDGRVVLHCSMGNYTVEV